MTWPLLATLSLDELNALREFFACDAMRTHHDLLREIQAEVFKREDARMRALQELKEMTREVDPAALEAARRELDALAADTGDQRWARTLPEEDADALVDVAAGTPVRWVPGKGWIEGDELAKLLAEGEASPVAEGFTRQRVLDRLRYYIAERERMIAQVLKMLEDGAETFTSTHVHVLAEALTEARARVAALEGQAADDT